MNRSLAPEVESVFLMPGDAARMYAGPRAPEATVMPRRNSSTCIGLLPAFCNSTMRIAPSPQAMVRVALAPCSPFSVTGRLMEESAALARRLGLPLHTHLAETLEELEAACEVQWEAFGSTPAEVEEVLPELEKYVASKA